ncbi:MAG: polynucleotide adenylyltransferase PcnB [Thioalkalispiraceae bacterium]
MTHQPVIIPRAEHNISRKDISEPALKVLYRLKKAGYAAYLVGGGVRDLLLGKHPKDFDVATDASPEEVRALFSNCRLIGRRFRLAHVHFGREIIEVATFRGHHENGEGEGVVENGMILRDNVYGTVEEDAMRRDFTVNALYYNIADFSVVDYTGGLQDLKQHKLRLIGDPMVRFKEDPVRMLRAIRFAAKLEFQLHETIDRLIAEQGKLLANVPAARLFDEILKLFLSGHGVSAYHLLKEHDLLQYLFPLTSPLLKDDDYSDRFISQALANTDTRIQQDKPVTPAFLFAALLWLPVRQQAGLLQQQGMTPLQAMQVAGDDITREQVSYVTLPKRFSFPMREIWINQVRLEMRRGKRALRLLQQPRFRASYDFLLLRNQAGESLQELCDWWTAFQEQSDEQQRQMINQLNKGQGQGKKRRRRSRKKNSARKSSAS